MSSSKPSTYLLDPIPTKPLKDTSQLSNSSVLILGYIPQAFNVEVIKPLLKTSYSLSSEQKPWKPYGQM